MKKRNLPLVVWAILASSAPALAGQDEDSFPPDEGFYKYPIRRIDFGQADNANGDGFSNNMTLYVCQGSQEECLVDLSQATSLEAFSAAVNSYMETNGVELREQVRYNILVIHSCGDDATNDSTTIIRAKGQSSALSLKTKDTTAGIGSGGDAEETDIVWTCSSKYIYLPHAIVVGSDGAQAGDTVLADGDTVELNLFASLRYALYTKDTPADSANAGCNAGPGQVLCSAVPALIPYAKKKDDSEYPKVEFEHYLIAHHATNTPDPDHANASLILAIEKTSASHEGEAFYAFPQPYYSPLSMPCSVAGHDPETDEIMIGDPNGGPNYDAGTSITAKVVEGVKGYEILGGGGDIDKGRIVIDFFTRSDDTTEGVCRMRSVPDLEWNYLATRVQ